MLLPLHTPLPAVTLGGAVHTDEGQLDGLLTTAVVVPQPLADFDVRVTLVPTAIPVTVLPDMVPAEAVTIPLLLNVTLYVPVPLHTALPAVKEGAAVEGALIVIVLVVQPLSVIVAVTAVPVATPLMVPDVEPAPPPVTVPVEAVTVEVEVFVKFTV